MFATVEFSRTRLESFDVSCVAEIFISRKLLSAADLFCVMVIKTWYS